MEPARPAITFDADGRVRVLDEDKFKATEELEKEARAFIGSKFGALQLHIRDAAPKP